MLTKTRFGQNLLGIGLLLGLIVACTALCLSVFNRGKDAARHSSQGESNGRAISKALDFDYTSLGDWNGDKYVDRGTGILRVKPNGPFDKAGIKRDDHILVSLRNLRTLLIQQRGKTLVLPVQRAGQRRFSVTVTVPRFTVPYPELMPSAPVSPEP